MENEVNDRFGVASGAQKKAIYATLQALVAHAMTTDPTFSDRLVASVEDYLTPLSDAEQDQDFAARVRANIHHIVGSPGSEAV
ncbi:hypothetical protein [Pseudorhizobium marinum]|uniref:hypothetical protein n=1 Tax=Pseudorhizobium marinum TaxID=1496690 RepID=UPI000497D371|nr:hypothetical protein [Pseudorhizobium marinum]